MVWWPARRGEGRSSESSRHCGGFCLVGGLCRTHKERLLSFNEVEGPLLQTQEVQGNLGASGFSNAATQKYPLPHFSPSVPPSLYQTLTWMEESRFSESLEFGSQLGLPSGSRRRFLFVCLTVPRKPLPLTVCFGLVIDLPQACHFLFSVPQMMVSNGHQPHRPLITLCPVPPMCQRYCNKVHLFQPVFPFSSPPGEGLSNYTATSGQGLSVLPLDHQR